MARLNKALLRRLARKLRRLRHEEHYDQRHWAASNACGTAACIAGHALIECGWKPRLYFDTWERKTIAMEFVKDGKEADAEVQAEKLLGLPENSGLFHPNGSEWPDEFRERFQEAIPDGPAKQRPSRVAADLLDALADGKVEPF